MEKHAGLPSWVPNWRCEINRSFAWLRDEEKKPLFKASANLEVELVEEENDRVLAIMRYKVDEVEEVRGPWNVDVTGETYRFPHETYINYLSQVGQFCLISKAKDANIYRDSERRDETVWWVPVGDLEQDETFLPYHGMANLDEYKKRVAEIGAMGDMASGYRTRMWEMKGKRPFISTIGYVGMGPSYTSTGDIIVVLAGASIPFIIRPLGEGKYRFLGQCYCDGIMEGEIVTEDRRENIVLI
ncbi:hypothetical protein BCR34DRAFT_621946 [Clohesyomyces aquaticus]|uniref:Heterokaryon incompatibility protein-domain-containing protein n=1 Tax=Clohesyomyces aquaticus TaxID=1231657 RepID=A0A1Y2A3X3_9PLEO|nr:hypothetical protein BCR34DRAFT_621946 [Clohesyomyces aquaticus]